MDIESKIQTATLIGILLTNMDIKGKLYALRLEVKKIKDFLGPKFVIFEKKLP